MEDFEIRQAIMRVLARHVTTFECAYGAVSEDDFEQVTQEIIDALRR